MANAFSRIGAATAGSLVVISGLIGAKALGDATTTPADQETTSPGPTTASHTHPVGPTPSLSPTPSATPTPSASPTSSPTSASSSTQVPTPTSAPGARDGTFTGQPAMTRFGNVQVAIEVSGGQITDIRVVDYPRTDQRDQMINAYAIPILVQSALAAQSADIDTVGGATYTSLGYRQSLQSAIDQAGL